MFIVSWRIYEVFFLFQKLGAGIGLVAQWWRIHLPTQETRVQSLSWEDPTCGRAMKPVDHSYWAFALEPGATTTEATCRDHGSPRGLEPVLRSERGRHHGRPACRSQRGAPALRSESKPEQQRRPRRPKDKQIHTSIFLKAGHEAGDSFIHSCWPGNRQPLAWQRLSRLVHLKGDSTERDLEFVCYQLIEPEYLKINNKPNLI